MMAKNIGGLRHVKILFSYVLCNRLHYKSRGQHIKSLRQTAEAFALLKTGNHGLCPWNKKG